MRVRLPMSCLLALALVQPSLLLAQSTSVAPGVAYSGGDGTTIRKSIVIVGARTAEEGAAAQLQWVREHLPGATIESKGQVTGPPHYDVVTVKLASGALLDLHFDTTAFHGK